MADIVGRTFKFQVKLTPFNFTATRQTITVTQIYEEINDDVKNIQEEEVQDNEVTDAEEACKGDDTVEHKDKRLRRE